MGQILGRVQSLEYDLGLKRQTQTSQEIVQFPNLKELPPELGLQVLSNLNATDLCLAGCVWDDLANAEILWHGLCRNQWGYLSIYGNTEPGFSYKKLYLQMDEASLTFNADVELGMEYLFKNNLLVDNSESIARFLHLARPLDGQKKRELLQRRRDILDHLVHLQNFEDQFLPNALRKFFMETHPPNDRGSYLHTLVDLFSERFIACNPKFNLSKDAVYVVSFSLIMLSVDLSSPHVKNKMSKREFIRNTRRATDGINDDFAGHLYDNVYLIGHVAPEA